MSSIIRFFAKKVQRLYNEAMTEQHQEQQEEKPARQGWRKVIKWLLIAITVIVVGLVAWLGLTGWQTVSKIIDQESPGAAPFLTFLHNIDPNQLKGEGDGRINILLLGIGGKNHPGGQLSDTNIVASIDPENKKIALLSLPRDLYVPIDGKNTYNKLNAAYSWGETNKKITAGGVQNAKNVVGKILDLPIHYYVRADFRGFEKMIDILGGIDIYVEKDLYDPLFPAENMIDFEPFFIKAGQHHLDGETALKYARSRETTSDFDRSRRQQQILVAMKERALTLNILANPLKIQQLFTAAGENIRTDLQLREIERLAKISLNIVASDITTMALDTSDGGLLTSFSDETGYHLIPAAGQGNFTEIQKLAHRIFTDPYLVKEKATIELRNASGQSGLGGKIADLLRDYGYSVSKIGLADQEQEQTVIYDYSRGQKKYTLKFLEQRFGAVPIQPPATDSQLPTTDIVLILGKDSLKLGGD